MGRSSSAAIWLVGLGAAVLAGPAFAAGVQVEPRAGIYSGSGLNLQYTERSLSHARV